MTFKHKLSMRLALMRDRAVMVAAAALVASCTPADQSISDPPRPSYATAVASSGTILLQEGFEDNAFGARGWYDNASMATTTAQHLPGSASAAEFHFPAGATTPTSGGAARHLFPASPTLYVSYWVKYSSNWVGSGRLYHPHEFLVLSDQDGDWDGPSNNWLTLYVEHFYQNGGIPRLAVQDNKAINTSYGALPVNLTAITENRSTAGCNGIVEPNMPNECYNAPPWYNDKKIDAGQPYFSPTAGPGYKGDWNHVEVYFQLNSVAGGVGVADGVMQYWFNGALVIDRHDILYRTGARSTLQLHQFLIAPYIGDGSPVDQYMWVDDLTLATGRVGSDTIPPAPTNPGSVADLAVTGVTDSSATLSFTEVSDGTGLPASYDVRFAVAPLAFWSASDVAVGTCKVPTAGMAIGAKRTCTVLGLAPTTAYQFQLVSFRGTLNLNAVFGGLSNIASGTSAAKAPVSVASVAVSPATGS
ncbi:MAG TPA: fibronectin type III domain-containing protein, partial [Mycobacterium sp.]|nr:fibronectin type III domain-containing protein [Mycobacterium sp.]